MRSLRTLAANRFDAIVQLLRLLVGHVAHFRIGEQGIKTGPLPLGGTQFEDRLVDGIEFGPLPAELDEGVAVERRADRASISSMRATSPSILASGKRVKGDAFCLGERGHHRADAVRRVAIVENDVELLRELAGRQRGPSP